MVMGVHKLTHYTVHTVDTGIDIQNIRWEPSCPVVQIATVSTLPSFTSVQQEEFKK